MEKRSATVKNLRRENENLLVELESAYKNLELVLLQSNLEKEIAYKELEKKYSALEHAYADISQKENMLIHLEKLSSIGQFITEIVHELKNPLTVISGITDMLLLDDLPEEIAESMGRIPEQVKRMTNYLNRFRGMAYKSKEDFEYFDMNDNIRDFLDTIEILKPKDILIEQSVDLEPMIVHGDPYQITQIYLNLAKNAFDAMAGKEGILKITSRLLQGPEMKNTDLNASASCQSPKSWTKILNKHETFACVEFKDSGTGIAQELIENIFDAFFTTKERGKGTGLGLSIATDITRRHNANLTVKSKVGDGTSFLLVLPVSEEKIELSIKDQETNSEFFI